MIFTVDFPPGLRNKGTEYGSKGFWYNCDAIRWVEGVLQPEGGSRTFSTTTLTGMGRSIIAWKSGALAKLSAIGTHSKLYTMSSSGVLSNITPARTSGTYANNPLSTTISTPTVTVAHTSHGLTVGDTVVIAGAAAIGGITPNGTFVVATTPTANTYTYAFTSNATSSVAGGGGAAVTYVYEISPGLADSASTGGYGYGLYGAGTYGTPRTGYGITTDARVWTLDTFGQYLVAAPGQWGDLYEWQLNTSTRAAKISNSPTALAVIVTDEGFVFALGSAGNPRNVAWCDQGVNTTWTPAATNQAGDYDLQTFGKIICGRKAKGSTLVFTDHDVHRATYIGGTFIYNIERIGDGCGIIAAGAAGAVDNVIVWMGVNNFWVYDGYVRPLPCEIAETVFKNLNTLQRAKISCRYDSAFGEFTWYYPSSGSTENDSYVRWHSREAGSVWSRGDIVRLAGVDRGAYLSPMAVGSDGYVYEHEVGVATAPFIESAPVELEVPQAGIGPGERIAHLSDYWPDEKTAGEVTITIKAKNFPNGTETEFGPYTAANPRNLRIAGRQFKVRFEGVAMTDWRVGSPRFTVKMGGKR